jgi:bifunctional NMN adenylyltransferase/nudix hydrolase
MTAFRDNVPDNYQIGVIIGRFQVAELHEAHRKLFESVCAKHQRVLVFVGVSPVLNSRRNPLDFETRKKMLQDAYPDLIVMPIFDNKSDAAWTAELDRRIREIYPLGNVLLYGGRDSFIQYYQGQFDTFELSEDMHISGTENRDIVSRKVRGSEDFRAGAIYATYNRYPISYQVVDIACIDWEKFQVLMCRKANSDRYGFIGGFVDVQDSSLEVAADREFREETGGAEPGVMEYITSIRLTEDWRYRSENDKLMSALFATTLTFGPLVASDDIEELKWISLDWDELESVTLPVHQSLLKPFREYIKKKLETTQGSVKP